MYICTAHLLLPIFKPTVGLEQCFQTSLNSELLHILGEQTELPLYCPTNMKQGHPYLSCWIKQEYPFLPVLWNRLLPPIPFDEIGYLQPQPTLSPIGWIMGINLCCVHGGRTTWDLHCRHFLSFDRELRWTRQRSNFAFVKALKLFGDIDWWHLFFCT